MSITFWYTININKKAMKDSLHILKIVSADTTAISIGSGDK